LGREALKTGLNLASDVMEGQNVTQAAKSRLKSTGQNLLQKAMDTVGPPGEPSIKRAAKKDLGPLGSMSVLFALKSHVPHWSESVVLQTNPIPISYIRKSFGVPEPFLTEDVFRCVP
jgi:hypothetical protein